MANDTKYSVNGKLLDLASRLTALEKANAELRVHLWGALETKANDLKHVIQDSIRVPVDGARGKDGVDGATGPQGIQGQPGDLLYAGPEEVKAAADALRAEKVRLRAKYQAALFQAIVDAEKHSTSSYCRIFKARLENLKREFDLE